MSANQPKISKAQRLLLAIFGEPKSGFVGVGLPTELEVVSYHMWLMELEEETKRGTNRSVGFGDAVTTVANSLQVHWRMNCPETQLVTTDCVKQKIRVILAKVNPLSRFTQRLGDEEWIANQRKSFLSIVDIGAKAKVSSMVRLFFNRKIQIAF